MSLEQTPERKGLYAGSFDPPTNGHLWMIKHGAKLFDELHVAVAVNPDKHTRFSPDERVEMLSEISQDLDNVAVSQFEGIYTVKYARELGCDFLLRGLRNAKDLDEEQRLSSFNRGIASDIETTFLLPTDELLKVSSSAVNGMVGPEGWEHEVAPYVPEFVLGALKKRQTLAK